MITVQNCVFIFFLLPFLINSYEVLNWADYKARYSKSYGTSEDAQRQAIFDATKNTLTNIQASISTNSLSYTVNLNPYSDWTPEELRILMQGVRQKSNPRGDDFSEYQTGKIFGRRLAASSIDWKNQITGVRNQGSECASAWSFAVVAMCEAAVQLKEGQQSNFAEQYLLQCSSYSNCNGGYLEYALQRVINKNGLPSESKYSYDPSSSYSGICSSKDLTFVSQFFYSFYGLSDSQIITLLQNGPVTVSVSSDGWNHYSSGIYQCPQNPTLDHAALLVGYTGQYWLLKNSWGTRWGINGYIKVSRSSSKNCGIGTAVFALGEMSLFSQLSVMVFFLAAFLVL